LTITGASVRDEKGAGIFGDYGNRNVEISNNIITGNGGYYGGGIWAHRSNHDWFIHSNTISQNGIFGGYGGGISFNDEPDEYEVEHGQPEHIWDDYAPGPPPGTIEIYNNLIFHNWSPDYGGGVALYETKDHLVIYGNTMTENLADDHGGAMFFEDTGPIDIYDNVFLRNFCYDDGGAISFEDVADTLSHINVWNNLFAENIADDHGENHARGGALAFDDVRDANVFNNTITGNIVAGSYEPAGGAIDSERHGHEYNGGDGPYMSPGYSDPKIFNNVIYDNYKLKYDQPLGTDEEDMDFTWGNNYRWSIDEMHVDNPALQGDWDSHLNSESFTQVSYNDIRGGYSNGIGNVDLNPKFVSRFNQNWRLQGTSPVIDAGMAVLGPVTDLEGRARTVSGGMIDVGAFEYHVIEMNIVRLPTGIPQRVKLPKPRLPQIDPPPPPPNPIPRARPVGRVRQVLKP
ncbi:MAG: choice-of-anchor Q domain-containing protein, partial [Candidatus Krumholzibacteriia bacterium]